MAAWTRKKSLFHTNHCKEKLLFPNKLCKCSENPILHNFKVEKQQKFGVSFVLWHTKRDFSLALSPCSRKSKVAPCSGPGNSGYCTSYLSFMDLLLLYRKWLLALSLSWQPLSWCSWSAKLRFLFAAMCCWAYSDSESLPEDHIESLEELCHKSSLLSGA